MTRTQAAALAAVVVLTGGCRRAEEKPAAFVAGDGGFVRPLVEAGGRARITVDPADPESLYLAGQQEFIEGEFEKAAAHLRQSQRLRPAARTQHALGDALMAQARFGDAAEAFRAATELEPAKRISWMRLGRCLINSGRPSEAVAAYRRAQELKPEDAGALREEAEALIEAKRDEEAAARLEAAAKLEPAMAAADIKLVGQLRAKQGRWRDAAEAFQRSAELHKDAGICSEIGESLAMAGSFAEARRWFAEAARLDPKDPFAPEMVGELALRLGDAAGAKEAFAASLKAKARPAPHLALGRIAARAGDSRAALRELDEALGAATGEDANEAREIARYAGEIGQWGAAEKLLAMLAAEEQAGKDPALWVELAGARQRVGQKAAAVEACAKARALPGGEALACPPK